MQQDEKKRLVAEHCLQHLKRVETLGVGTGSTVDAFIDAIAQASVDIKQCVSSSKRSTERLQKHGFEVIELNQANSVDIYVDGADEAIRNKHLIKGGGGAMTGEKILASASRKFICLIDDSKLKSRLGQFPIAIEVLEMARSVVARKLIAMGGTPVLRENFTTDSGNPVLDVHNLKLTDAKRMEEQLNQIPGIVCHGLFVQQAAHMILVAGGQGVETIT